jgi:polar amino acid transport system permease protein
MDYFLETTKFIIMGAGVTFKIYFVTLVFGIPLGIIFAIGKLVKFKPLRFILGVYTWLFRGTPLLLQLFFTYYALPIMTNGAIAPSAMVAAYITFILNYAAYFTEIFRAGIQGVDKGQREAAKVLGMPSVLTMRKIILPQAFKAIVPPLGNEAITLIKDTALCSVLALHEILMNAKIVLSRDFNISSFIIAAIIYLILTFIIIQIFRMIEKRFSYYE